jgi:putative transport protein
MEFIRDILFGEGIAHSIFVFTVVIALGTALSKIKLGGISLGSTWILFAGIAASHFGMVMESDMLSFARDFGLTLFVFSIGLQIGPGFFSALRTGGVKQMWLALLVMVVGVVVTMVIAELTGTPLQTMVGIMDGAAVNTPAMGATQQAYLDLTGIDDSTIPMGFAIAYPFGVVAVIIAFIILKPLLKIKLDKENEALKALSNENKFAAKYSLEVINGQIDGKSVSEIRNIISRQFVISRI